jgi:hypothetical protein
MLVLTRADIAGVLHAPAGNPRRPAQVRDYWRAEGM